MLGLQLIYGAPNISQSVAIAKIEYRLCYGKPRDMGSIVNILKKFVIFGSSCIEKRQPNITEYIYIHIYVYMSQWIIFGSGNWCHMFQGNAFEIVNSTKLHVILQWYSRSTSAASLTSIQCHIPHADDTIYKGKNTVLYSKWSGMHRGSVSLIFKLPNYTNFNTFFCFYISRISMNTKVGTSSALLLSQ